MALRVVSTKADTQDLDEAGQKPAFARMVSTEEEKQHKRDMLERMGHIVEGLDKRGAGFARFAAASTTNSEDIKPKFTFHIFMRMLVVHITFPICLPFIWCIHGKHVLQNLFFWPDWNRGFLTQAFAALNICIAIAAYSLGFGESIYRFGFEIFFPVFLVLWHRTVVALKYAYAPSSYMEKFYKQQLTVDEILALQLITGWTAGTPTAIKIESDITIRNLKIDYNDAYVATEDSEAKLQSFFNNFEFQFGNDERYPGRNRFCILQLQTRILELVFKHCSFEGWMKVTDYISIIIAMMPFLNHLFLSIYYPPSEAWNYFHGKLDAQIGIPLTVTMMLMVVYQTNLLYGAMFLFFQSLNFDFTRRRKLMEVLTHMIQIPSPISEVHKDMPDMKLFFKENVIAWFAMRKFFMVIGQTYRSRAETYLTCFILFIIGALVVIITNAINGTKFQTTGIIGGIDVGVSFILVFFIYCNVIYSGSKLNHFYVVHRETLSRMKVTLRICINRIRADARKIKQQILEQGTELPPTPEDDVRMTLVADFEQKDEPKGKSKAELQLEALRRQILDCEDAEMLIESIQKLLIVESRTSAVRVMGFHPSANQITGLIAAILTIASTFVRLYFSS
jgi:hypothetical protein